MEECTNVSRSVPAHGELSVSFILSIGEARRGCFLAELHLVGAGDPEGDP